MKLKENDNESGGCFIIKGVYMRISHTHTHTHLAYAYIHKSVVKIVQVQLKSYDTIGFDSRSMIPISELDSCLHCYQNSIFPSDGIKLYYMII